MLPDTQALLWFLQDDPKLSDTARDAIADGRNRQEISPASYWEIAIKIARQRAQTQAVPAPGAVPGSD